MFAKINFHDEFYQKLKLLVLPITMQQFMLALVSATDAIMLGAVSQTSLSAVSLAGQIQFVLNLFISGISAGSGIMAAQYWGKKDAASIEEVMPIALRTNLIFSGVFTVFAAVAPEVLMRIFTSDPALIESGAVYLRAVSLSYLLCGISQIYLILLKNTGYATVSSRISCTAVVVNIICNAILIYGLLGLPALGIQGAAYATVIARLVELVWSYLETKQSGRVQIIWKKMFHAADAVLTKDFWRYTMPVLGGAVEELEFIPDNVIIGGYGELYLLCERAGTDIAVSDQYRFIEDQTVYRATARYDGMPVIAEGFVVIGLSGATPTADAVTFTEDKANKGTAKE